MANEMLTSGGIQVGWGSQWETLAGAITDYYGGGIGSAQYQQVVNMLNSGSYTMEEMDAILGQIPEFTRTYNSAGQLTSVSYNVSTNTATSAAGSVAQQINSNVANSTATQFSTVQNITKDAQTGKVAISDNVTKYTNGTAGTAKVAAANAIGAIAAVSTGINLGKSFDARLYNANPEFWNEHGMSTLNPATWSSITAGRNDLGSTLFNFVLGINGADNNPQLYLDQNAFAYMAAYMGMMGAFDTGALTPDPSKLPDRSVLNYPNFDYSRFQLTAGGSPFITSQNPAVYAQIPSTALGFLMKDQNNYTSIWGFSDSSFMVETLWRTSATARTRNGITYYCLPQTGAIDPNDTYYNIIIPPLSYINTIGYNQLDIMWDLAYLYYHDAYSGGGGIEGIDDQTGATVFNGSGISDWTDIAAVLAALQLQYPDLWANRIEFSPDGDTTQTYIPVGFPTGGVGYQPTSEGATQTDLSPDITGGGENATDELIKTLIEMLQTPKAVNGMDNTTDTPTTPVDPNGDPRGTGETPVIVIPTGSASALWKIYNPSQAQLDTFGAWLWSSNFVDQLLKLFNDPMQAIIGLHKIYATPPTSGSGAIKVGYLTSDASANYVSAQYTEIDCGTVNLKEYFNNVFDYDPFTKVSIFLPFIGFRQLNISDVMRGDISVNYGVDVLTGACLAKISVKRDLNDNVLYTFAGNCAVQYPVSSGSYVGIVTGLLGIAGGIAGTIASGGALAPMLMGAGASIGAMHTNVEHSGNISSNAGAMGSKKPYIIIERPQTKLPLLGVDIEGKPQNETVVLGSLTGHVRVKAAEFNGFSCTAGELVKIKQLLSSGIII